MMYVCGVTTVTGLVSAEGALTVGGNTNITGITTLAGAVSYTHLRAHET